MKTKRAFKPHNAYGNILQQFGNYEIYKDFKGKPFICVWLGDELFFP